MTAIDGIAERIALYRGLVPRVAARLGMSRSYVYRVAIGERKSERVEKALAVEIARVEAVVMPPDEPGRKRRVPSPRTR